MLQERCLGETGKKTNSFFYPKNYVGRKKLLLFRKYLFIRSLAHLTREETGLFP